MSTDDKTILKIKDIAKSAIPSGARLYCMDQEREVMLATIQTGTFLSF